MEGNNIKVATDMVGLFDSVTPKEMAEYQRQDNQISPIIEYAKKIRNHQKSSYIKSSQSCHVNLLFNGIGLYSNKEFYISCTSLMRLNTISPFYANTSITKFSSHYMTIWVIKAWIVPSICQEKGSIGL